MKYYKDEYNSVVKMTDIGKIRLIYLGEDNQKRSVIGKGVDKGNYVEVTLNPSKRRTKFNIVLIPWGRVIKAIVF